MRGKRLISVGNKEDSRTEFSVLLPSLFQALCEKAAGDERGLVEKEGAPSPFDCRIPLAADPTCRLLGFSIVLTDREPGTGYLLSNSTETLATQCTYVMLFVNCYL